MPEIVNLEQLLDRISDSARERERIALGDVMESVGRRSFGPALMVAGLVAIIPGVGDIPGVTTVMAVLVLLVAVQMLFHRERLWLPNWLLRRSVSHERLCKGLSWMRRPARFVDRLIRPRLHLFTHFMAIAIGCIAVAAIMPLMEVVPFGAVAAGAALTAFSLALIARDGLLALIAYAATGLTIGLGIYHFMTG